MAEEGAAAAVVVVRLEMGRAGGMGGGLRGGEVGG
jgi:hypothetical protein